MRFLPLSLLIPLVLPSIQLPPANAQRVQSIFASRAQDGGVAQLKVFPGYGLNLFFQTSERIKKAWLDDPSQIALDFDSKPPAATLIHLRNISALTFPGLRRSPDHNTLLSILTDAGKLYQFKLKAAEGTPQYTTLAIVSDNRGTPMVEINNYRRGSLADVERGLQIEQIQKIIPPNSPLVGRVLNFTALVRNGSTLNEAATKAGVSMGLVAKLADIGQTGLNSTPVATPNSQGAAQGAGQSNGNTSGNSKGQQRHHHRKQTDPASGNPNTPLPNNFSTESPLSENPNSN